MRIGSNENYIDLEIQLVSDSTLPNYGDALIGVEALSSGYFGKSQVWVAKRELDLFSESILELEKSRNGEAILTSMSPNELYLRVYTHDGVGHVALEGKIGHQVIGQVCFNHSVEFGFVLEPENLVRLSKAKWVNH